MTQRRVNLHVDVVDPHGRVFYQVVHLAMAPDRQAAAAFVAILSPGSIAATVAPRPGYALRHKDGRICYSVHIELVEHRDDAPAEPVEHFGEALESLIRERPDWAHVI